MKASREEFFSMLDDIFAFTRLSHVNQSIPRAFKCGETLYISEISTLYLIGSTDNATVGQIATETHRTSSAVSQIVKKLIQKGLVRKEADPSNRKTHHLLLTDKGNQLLLEHCRDDDAYYDELHREFPRMTSREVAAVCSLINGLYEHTSDAIAEKMSTAQGIREQDLISLPVVGR